MSRMPWGVHQQCLVRQGEGSYKRFGLRGLGFRACGLGLRVCGVWSLFFLREGPVRDPLESGSTMRGFHC